MAGVESEREYAEGDVIYEKGDAATHLYLIQNGRVVATIAGETVSLGQGQIFGDGGMVSGKYKATVRAGHQGCTVLPMAFETLKAEIGRSPPLVRLFITNLLAQFEIAADLLDH